MGEDILREQLRRETVFKDEATLDLSYIPPRLPHRESEYRILARAFRPLIEAPGSMTVKSTIVGPPGVGKTALTRRFCLDLEKNAYERNVNLKCIYVNAQEFRGSPFQILVEVASKLIEGFPRRGFSFEELLDSIVRILEERNYYILLAIDEAEALLTGKGLRLLAGLSRLYERFTTGNQRVNLITVVRNPKAFKKLEDPILETLQGQIIQMHSYHRDEMYDIVEYRASLAFKEGAISEEALSLIADISGSSGNARWAVELLLRAGRHADNLGSPIVLPIHVRAVQQSILYTLPMKDYLRSLSEHELLILLAVARLTWYSPEEAYFNTGRVEEAYRVVCEEYKVKPKKHTQLWTYLKTLSLTGLLEAKVSNIGFRGRTTLIGLPAPPEAVARIVEEELTRR